MIFFDRALFLTFFREHFFRAGKIEKKKLNQFFEDLLEKISSKKKIHSQRKSQERKRLRF
jgi:hypothetical protein